MLLKSLLICITFWFFSNATLAVEKITPPRFADYPAKVVDMSEISRQAAVITEENSSMETRLRELAANGSVGFAGRYAITGVGCGGGCVMWLSMDLTTGKTLSGDMPPFSYCLNVGAVELLKRADSRLMAIVGIALDDSIDTCFVHYYVENQGELTLLQKTPWIEDNVDSLRQSMSVGVTP